MTYDSELIAGKCVINLKIVKDITDGQSLELSKTVKFLKIGLEMRTRRPDSHKYLILVQGLTILRQDFDT